jgi:hypothetical protein
MLKTKINDNYNNEIVDFKKLSDIDILYIKENIPSLIITNKIIRDKYNKIKIIK